MSDPKKNKSSVIGRNILESLKDVGGSFAAQSTDLLRSTPEDFFKELIGLPKLPKRSGEIQAGESIKVSDVLSGREDQIQKVKAQMALERNLMAEEKRLTDRKIGELKMQLQALIFEISKVAESTAQLTTQTEITMVEVPVNPGIYHVIFFEKVLEFLRSFRKKIDQAVVWLESTNKRAQKKNYWSMYKKKGSSFLLSPDHYLQRSAG